MNEEPANAMAEELTDAEAIPGTEPSAKAYLPQGNTPSTNTEVGLTKSTESSPEFPVEDTIAAVPVDTTISAASLETSGYLRRRFQCMPWPPSLRCISSFLKMYAVLESGRR